MVCIYIYRWFSTNVQWYQENQCPKFQLISPWKKWQNGRHFADDSLRWIFVNERFYVSVKIPLKCASRDPINNSPALVLVMAWGQAIIWTNAVPIPWRIYAALGRDGLNKTHTSHVKLLCNSIPWCYFYPADFFFSSCKYLRRPAGPHRGTHSTSLSKWLNLFLWKKFCFWIVN